MGSAGFISQTVLNPESPHYLTAVPFLRPEVAEEKHPVAMKLAGQMGPVGMPLSHENNHHN